MENHSFLNGRKVKAMSRGATKDLGNVPQVSCNLIQAIIGFWLQAMTI